MTTVYLHKKTQGEYEIVDFDHTEGGLVAGTRWQGFIITDDVPPDSWVVFYKSLDNGKCWGREVNMFFDGRFERVSS